MKVTSGMKTYVLGGEWKGLNPMNCILTSSVRADVVDMSARLVFVRMMFDVETPDPADEGQLARKDCASQVMDLAEEYVSMVCWFNPAFHVEDFWLLKNEVCGYCIAMWRSMLEHFSDCGTDWKHGFIGCWLIG